MPLIIEGHVDVDLVASALALPEGLGREEAGAIPWATFACADHPAVTAWDTAAAERWPHVLVHVGNSLQAPWSFTPVQPNASAGTPPEW